MSSNVYGIDLGTNNLKVYCKAIALSAGSSRILAQIELNWSADIA